MCHPKKIEVANTFPILKNEATEFSRSYKDEYILFSQLKQNDIMETRLQ
jgi:hypothetical protein